MYAVTGNLLNQLGAKGQAVTPPPPVARAAMASVLGAVCEEHGMSMPSIVREAVLCLLKVAKAATAPADGPLRLASLEALRGALEGAGPKNMTTIAQAEAVKVLRAAAAAPQPSGPTPAPPARGGGGAFGGDEACRCAVLNCVPPLVASAEELWEGQADTLDALVNLCVKHLEDPLPSVRATASRCLAAALLNATLAPGFRASRAPPISFARASGRSGGGTALSRQKSDNLGGGIKIGPFKLGVSVGGGGGGGGAPPECTLHAALNILSSHFCNKSASPETRAGLASAYVGLLSGLPRGLREQHALWVMGHTLDLAEATAGAPAALPAAATVLRRGLSANLSERAQLSLARALTAAIARQVTYLNCRCVCGGAVAGAARDGVAAARTRRLRGGGGGRSARRRGGCCAHLADHSEGGGSRGKGARGGALHTARHPLPRHTRRPLSRRRVPARPRPGAAELAGRAARGLAQPTHGAARRLGDGGRAREGIRRREGVRRAGRTLRARARRGCACLCHRRCAARLRLRAARRRALVRLRPHLRGGREARRLLLAARGSTAHSWRGVGWAPGAARLSLRTVARRFGRSCVKGNVQA
ncbi:hypothetical protein T492DRAFT_158629 [Pavlovales sp. CCMP2436]|nr:hypothetical protein T492DRAFT_158629 [Pavlovales sp. CCMP2436]